MAYAGKCDRCGGFYDLPLEHGIAIRTRVVDVFDDPVESKDPCPDCLKELHSFLRGTELASEKQDKDQIGFRIKGESYQHVMNRFMRKE